MLANGDAKQPEHEQPSVKVLGMEMTASCEGGEKWSRPESPVLPSSPPPPPEPVEPPQVLKILFYATRAVHIHFPFSNIGNLS